jgi:hypothetical protein
MVWKPFEVRGYKANVASDDAGADPHSVDAECSAGELNV